MAICVYIATTQGPVAVRGITAEEGLLESVMCLSGQTEKVAVSRRYSEFVSPGSGIIARRVGHDCFRVDVDGPIDTGDSWQAGMVVAHDLFAAGLLAETLSAADLLVWVTGEVNVREGAVLGVESVSRKLAKSLHLFEQARSQKIPVLVMYPQENMTELQLSAPLVGLPEEEFRTAPVSHLDELATCLPGINTPPRQVTPAGRSLRGWLVGAAVLVLLIATGWLLWPGQEEAEKPQERATRPDWDAW